MMQKMFILGRRRPVDTAVNSRDRSQPFETHSDTTRIRITNRTLFISSGKLGKT